ncbi:hypothetical protein PAECIP111893_02949 [Paenibacillus plantiphilus]|uniref:N-acetyltransferase domain-containing protein n=1 Tax=Paenibacillus plantiphilus TaxID=2905650 RepID=A0ABM9CC68_9BACL|nr:GNAT family N-acetyltransferase [Paenibacillus plantiphilus]CAH1208977.1 hypothetical protein PAECIP111893_02949 [Paenibacillus plantiphilus]
MRDSNKQDAVIRWASDSDVPNLAQVHIDSYRSAYVNIMPALYLEGMTLEQQLKRYEALLSEGKEHVAVMSVDERMIGYLVLEHCTDDVAQHRHGGEIHSIYLLQEYCGRGYGRMLLDWGIRQLGEMGWTHAIVWVLKDNRSARGFYEHAGFILSGRERLIQRGAELVQVSYQRTIS